MDARADAEQMKLLAGAIAHLSSYLDTGCPRAAHLARLLLHRLDGSQLDQELAASCEQLDQAISNPQQRRETPAGAKPGPSNWPRSRFSRAGGGAGAFQL